MFRTQRLILAFTLILSCTIKTTEALAWGKTGHRVVGQIAEDQLTPKALAKVRALIGNESLAQVSIWADWVRSDPARNFQSPWHYTSVEDGKAYQGPPDPERGDVVSAINEMIEILKGQTTHPKVTKAQALKLLVHFIGDIHQPLHVGRFSDRGGNSIIVKFFKNASNLHEVWDENIIEFHELAYTELARKLQKEQPSGPWISMEPRVWAAESIAARPLVYLFDDKFVDTKQGVRLTSHEEILRDYPGAWAGQYKDVRRIDPIQLMTAPQISYHYIYRTLPLIERRLYQGGMRLGYILNSIL